MREVTLDEVYIIWSKYKILCADWEVRSLDFGEYCDFLKEEFNLRIA